MTTSPCQVDAPPRPDPVQAVATFFLEDPARILAVASGLRGPDRAVESTVEGMSMGRTLPAGSRIRIQLVNRLGYEVGEVVAFLAGSQVIVHRVVHRARWGAGRGYLVTRGDVTLVPDPPVDQTHVLGAVTEVQYEGSWVAVSGRLRRSLKARVTVSLLLAAVASVLAMSPRAARSFANFLYRSAKSFQVMRSRKAQPGPQGPFPSGAA